MILESNSKLERQILLPHCFTPPATSSTLQNTPNSPNRLFIHMEYNKNDMPKKAVRSIVEATLKDTIDELGVSQITVSYSTPKIVKDLLSEC